MVASSVSAQTREQMANLFADMELVKQESGQTRLEMQRLIKENENLRAAIARLVENQEIIRGEYLDLITKTEARIDSLKLEIAKGDEQILNKVSDALDEFSNEITKSYDAIAQASAPAPVEATVTNNFSADFPKAGLEYTIAKGDNLWTIAQKHQSKVKWIQDANRITDPSKLGVGDVLFIPQE